jgi:hypothetical protein
MSNRKQSKGECMYCGAQIAKGAASRHIQKCPGRLSVVEQAEKGAGKNEELFYLRVEDAYMKEFWLDLEMRGSRTLEDLDMYLRDIWLECCGHLSEFSLERWGDEIPMERRVLPVFDKHERLVHIYDFGHSSETTIRVISKRKGKATTQYPIALMVRNLMPQTTCCQCEKPAEYLCQQCLYENGGEDYLLCAEHTEDHPCDDYGAPDRLVNSPRVGMCGYCGPAEPPY